MGWQDAPIVETKGKSKWESAPIEDQGSIAKSLTTLPPSSAVGGMPGGKDTIPEWAGRHPNIYGLLGAAKGISEVPETIASKIPLVGEPAKGLVSGTKKFLTGQAPYQEYLEAGAMGVGGALGALSLTPGGAYAGGALGYTAMKEAEKLGERLAGTAPKATSIKEEVVRPLTELAEGAAMEAVGPALGKVGRVVSKPFKEMAPSRIVERVAKWSTTVTPQEKKRLNETVLKNKLSFNEEGANKLDSLIDQKETFLEGTLAPHTERVTNIDSIANEVVDDILPRLEKTHISTYGKDSDTVKSIVKDWAEGTKSTLGGDKVSAVDMQSLKRQEYRNAAGTYDKPVTDIENATRKTLARVLKEKIEKVADTPDVKRLNSEMGDLLNAQKHIYRVTGRLSNKDYFGLPEYLSMGAGTITGGAPGAEIALVASKVARSSEVQMKIAQKLYDIQQSAIPQKVKDTLFLRLEELGKKKIPDSEKKIIIDHEIEMAKKEGTTFKTNERGLAKSPLTRVGSSISEMTPEKASSLVSEALGPMTAKSSAEVFRGMPKTGLERALESAETLRGAPEIDLTQKYAPKVIPGRTVKESAGVFAKQPMVKSARESAEILRKAPDVYPVRPGQKALPPSSISLPEYGPAQLPAAKELMAGEGDIVGGKLYGRKGEASSESNKIFKETGLRPKIRETYDGQFYLSKTSIDYPLDKSDLYHAKTAQDVLVDVIQQGIDLKTHKSDLYSRMVGKLKEAGMSDVRSKKIVDNAFKNLEGTDIWNLPPTRDELIGIKGEISAGEAGKRIHIEGEGSEGRTVIGQSSTFPEYFKNKGYNKKETINIIEKLERGEKLAKGQQQIWDDLIKGYRKQMRANIGSLSDSELHSIAGGK